MITPHQYPTDSAIPDIPLQHLENGTLIFKWCETQIPLRDILALTDAKPLYGHRSGVKAQTHWVAFLKPLDSATSQHDQTL